MSTSIGTNSSTLATEIKNGSIVGVSIDTAGVVTMPNTPNTQIGVGQTWQDVTASRALGVTYTNSTGKPILINVWATSQLSSTMGIQLTIDGGIVHYAYSPAVASAQIVLNVSGIIPAGKTYKVDYVANLPASVGYKELR